MSPDVKRAVEDLRLHFPGLQIEACPDGDGGAWVVVNDVEIGERFTHRATWVGFRIPFQYPYTDVYPHFVRGDLALTEGGGLPIGMTGCTFPLDNRPAIQVSRRSNRWDAGRDTASIKLAKVIEWLKGSP